MFQACFGGGGAIRLSFLSGTPGRARFPPPGPAGHAAGSGKIYKLQDGGAFAHPALRRERLAADHRSDVHS